MTGGKSADGAKHQNTVNLKDAVFGVAADAAELTTLPWLPSFALETVVMESSASKLRYWVTLASKWAAIFPEWAKGPEGVDFTVDLHKIYARMADEFAMTAGLMNRLPFEFSDGPGTWSRLRHMFVQIQEAGRLASDPDIIPVDMEGQEYMELSTGVDGTRGEDLVFYRRSAKELVYVDITSDPSQKVDKQKGDVGEAWGMMLGVTSAEAAVVGVNVMAEGWRPVSARSTGEMVYVDFTCTQEVWAFDGSAMASGTHVSPGMTHPDVQVPKELDAYMDMGEALVSKYVENPDMWDMHNANVKGVIREFAMDKARAITKAKAKMREKVAEAIEGYAVDDTTEGVVKALQDSLNGPISPATARVILNIAEEAGMSDLSMAVRALYATTEGRHFCKSTFPPVSEIPKGDGVADTRGCALWFMKQALKTAEGTCCGLTARKQFVIIHQYDYMHGVYRSYDSNYLMMAKNVPKPAKGTRTHTRVLQLGVREDFPGPWVDLIKRKSRGKWGGTRGPAEEWEITERDNDETAARYGEDMEALYAAGETTTCGISSRMEYAAKVMLAGDNEGPGRELVKEHMASLLVQAARTKAMRLLDMTRLICRGAMVASTGVLGEDHFMIDIKPTLAMVTGIKAPLLKFTGTSVVVVVNDPISVDTNGYGRGPPSYGSHNYESKALYVSMAEVIRQDAAIPKVISYLSAVASTANTVVPSMCRYTVAAIALTTLQGRRPHGVSIGTYRQLQGLAASRAGDILEAAKKADASSVVTGIEAITRATNLLRTAATNILKHLEGNKHMAKGANLKYPRMMPPVIYDGHDSADRIYLGWYTGDLCDGNYSSPVLSASTALGSLVPVMKAIQGDVYRENSTGMSPELMSAWVRDGWRWGESVERLFLSGEFARREAEWMLASKQAKKINTCSVVLQVLLYAKEETRASARVWKEAAEAPNKKSMQAFMTQKAQGVQGSLMSETTKAAYETARLLTGITRMEKEQRDAASGKTSRGPLSIPAAIDVVNGLKSLAPSNVTWALYQSMATIGEATFTLVNKDSSVEKERALAIVSGSNRPAIAFPEQVSGVISNLHNSKAGAAMNSSFLEKDKAKVLMKMQRDARTRHRELREEDARQQERDAAAQMARGDRVEGRKRGKNGRVVQPDGIVGPTALAGYAGDLSGYGPKHNMPSAYVSLVAKGGYHMPTLMSRIRFCISVIISKKIVLAPVLKKDMKGPGQRLAGRGSEKNVKFSQSVAYEAIWRARGKRQVA